LQKLPGLVAAAPAGLRIGESGQGVDEGVQIRTDLEPQVLEIVAGVHREGDLVVAEQA